MSMNNYKLLGLQKFDNVDIKLSLMVVGVFSIITIVSYFNELNRAGLLTRHSQSFPANKFAPGRASRSISLGDALIQSNKQVHRLNLDIQKIKDVGSSQKNKGKKTQQEPEEIKFQLRLGQNSAYETKNGSAVQIYTHKNVLPNFYTKALSTAYRYVELNDSVRAGSSRTARNNVSAVKKQYSNASLVFLYQHDPGGHFMKDCVKHVALLKHYPLLPAFSATYRKEWSTYPQKKKNVHRVMFGGVSFGICEEVTRPCTYALIVDHPIDRLLTTFYACRESMNHSFCHFPKQNLAKMTLHEYIHAQGNRLFQRLLYYSKHCRLIGEDEICLQDTRASFVLSNQEYKVHLTNVLQNLENWFSVVGLVHKLKDSLYLFDNIFGLNFPQNCAKHWFHFARPAWYKDLRARLLNDTRIRRWLHADLAIYSRLEEIFKSQLYFYELQKKQPVTYLDKTPSKQRVGITPSKQREGNLTDKTTKHTRKIEEKHATKAKTNDSVSFTERGQTQRNISMHRKQTDFRNEGHVKQKKTRLHGSVQHHVQKTGVGIEKVSTKSGNLHFDKHYNSSNKASVYKKQLVKTVRNKRKPIPMKNVYNSPYRGRKSSVSDKDPSLHQTNMTFTKENHQTLLHNVKKNMLQGGKRKNSSLTNIGIAKSNPSVGIHGPSSPQQTTINTRLTYPTEQKQNKNIIKTLKSGKSVTSARRTGEGMEPLPVHTKHKNKGKW